MVGISKFSSGRQLAYANNLIDLFVVFFRFNLTLGIDSRLTTLFVWPSLWSLGSTRQALTDYVLTIFTCGLYRCGIPEIVCRFVSVCLSISVCLSVFLYLCMRIKICMNYYGLYHHHPRRHRHPLHLLRLRLRRRCGHTTVGVAGSSPSSMNVGPRMSITVWSPVPELKSWTGPRHNKNGLVNVIRCLFCRDNSVLVTQKFVFVRNYCYNCWMRYIVELLKGR